MFKIQDHFDPHSKGTKVFPRLLLLEIVMLLCYNSPINRIIYKIGSKNYFIDQCKTVLLHTIQKFQVTEPSHFYRILQIYYYLQKPEVHTRAGSARLGFLVDWNCLCTNKLRNFHPYVTLATSLERLCWQPWESCEICECTRRVLIYRDPNSSLRSGCHITILTYTIVP